MDRVIQHLEPPQDFKYRLKEADDKNDSDHWFVKFIKTFFFGDGY